MDHAVVVTLLCRQLLERHAGPFGMCARQRRNWIPALLAAMLKHGSCKGGFSLTKRHERRNPVFADGFLRLHIWHLAIIQTELLLWWTDEVKEQAPSGNVSCFFFLSIGTAVLLCQTFISTSVSLPLHKTTRQRLMFPNQSLLSWRISFWWPGLSLVELLSTAGVLLTLQLNWHTASSVADLHTGPALCLTKAN